MRYTQKDQGLRALAVSVIIIILALQIPDNAYTQDSLYTTVEGVVRDSENGLPVPNLMVVNKRTQQGYFGDNSGFYRIKIRVGDPLIYAATGYTTVTLNVSEPVPGGVTKLDIRMEKLSVDLKPVVIFTERDLREIQEDIQKLGFDENDYRISGIEAASSPITFLYQQFSRKERNKRMVAEMRNNDRRRDLLKELFRKYVDHDIIQLEEEEFDDFIDFSRVSDEFLKSSTQYEFIMYIKKRFEVYQAIHDLE